MSQESLLLPEGFGTLGINMQRPNWRAEVNLHTTPEYLARLRHLRLNHDGMGCYFCGFPEGPFMELHHVNHDHTDYSNGNLRAVCSLCHRLQHLGWVGIKAQGSLIHLPSDVMASEVSPDGSPAWSLEVFNIIQRFYLMSEYLTPVQQKKLESLPLKGSINNLLNSFKRRNYEASYHAIKTEMAKKAEERKRLQEMNKEQKDEYFKEQLEERERERKKNTNKSSEGSYLSGDLHIIDLVDGLCEEHILYEESGKKERSKRNPVDAFLETQMKGSYGRLTVWFNKGVFEPFEPQPTYTLKDRMDYYNDLGMFTPQGISQVLHDSRVTRKGDEYDFSSSDYISESDIKNKDSVSKEVESE